MISFKKCTQCSATKELKMFSKHKSSAQGIRSYCKECSNKASSAWRKLNPKQVKRSRVAYYAANKEKDNKASSAYSKANPERMNNIRARRRAAKLKATPSWSNRDEIFSYYRLAKLFEATFKEKHHVDHIIPLQGKKICGLHVTENLQVLTATENLKKSNHWESV